MSIKSDSQLKQDIESELLRDPTINSAQIGVIVNDGAVTLLRVVSTYAQRLAAEAATKRVSGVRTVAQDLTVEIVAEHEQSDSEIASAVQRALNWDVCIPKSVTATVREGIVTLEGHVAWNFERDAAESAVRHFMGVTAVVNFIALKPSVLASDVKAKMSWRPT